LHLFHRAYLTRHFFAAEPGQTARREVLRHVLPQAAEEAEAGKERGQVGGAVPGQRDEAGVDVNSRLFVVTHEEAK